MSAPQTIELYNTVKTVATEKYTLATEMVKEHGILETSKVAATKTVEVATPYANTAKEFVREQGVINTGKHMYSKTRESTAPYVQEVSEVVVLKANETKAVVKTAATEKADALKQYILNYYSYVMEMSKPYVARAQGYAEPVISLVQGYYKF